MFKHNVCYTDGNELPWTKLILKGISYEPHYRNTDYLKKLFCFFFFFFLQRYKDIYVKCTRLFIVLNHITSYLFFQSFYIRFILCLIWQAFGMGSEHWATRHTYFMCSFYSQYKYQVLQKCLNSTYIKGLWIIWNLWYSHVIIPPRRFFNKDEYFSGRKWPFRVKKLL